MEFNLLYAAITWILIISTFLLWLECTPNGKRFKYKYIDKNVQKDLNNYLEKKQNYRNLKNDRE